MLVPALQSIATAAGAASAALFMAAIVCAGYFHLYNWWHEPPSTANQRWQDLLLGNAPRTMRSGIWFLRLAKTGLALFLIATAACIAIAVAVRQSA